MKIRCPKCKAENPDTQSFCGDCSTQLTPLKDIPSVTKTLETPIHQLTKGTLFASMLLFSACSPEKAQGKITGAYQPLRSRMVQMYIEVKLDDGSKVSALLPEDQAIWDKASNIVQGGRHLGVEIKRKGKKKTWEFVRFLED
jgi:hypothetical protein